MPSKTTIADQLARFIAQRYPNAPAGEEARALAASWLDDLADVDDGPFAEACRAYRNSPAEADRWFPTPGRLRAHLPAGRAAAFLGSDEDCERGFDDFVARMRVLAFHPDREDPARHLDPRDPYRNDAMFAAKSALVAPAWWGDPVHDPIGYGQRRRAWCAVYREARKAQAADPAAVQITASSRKLLSVGA